MTSRELPKVARRISIVFFTAALSLISFGDFSYASSTSAALPTECKDLLMDECSGGLQASSSSFSICQSEKPSPTRSVPHCWPGVEGCTAAPYVDLLKVGSLCWKSVVGGNLSVHSFRCGPAERDSLSVSGSGNCSVVCEQNVCGCDLTGFDTQTHVIYFCEYSIGDPTSAQIQIGSGPRLSEQEVAAVTSDDEVP